jgi:16S rRNA processing protein RimM
VNSLAPDWVTIAVLGKPRGIRGEITAFTLSSKPERFEALGRVFLFGANSTTELEVEFTWFHSGVLVFKFKGIDNIEAATPLSGAEVRVPVDQRTPLEPGEYFQSDLVGCEVVDRRTGEQLGHVIDWNESAGPGLLVLEGGMLIPFARAICVEIDPAARRIGVELPEGLKELNRA